MVERWHWRTFLEAGMSSKSDLVPNAPHSIRTSDLRPVVEKVFHLHLITVISAGEPTPQTTTHLPNNFESSREGRKYFVRDVLYCERLGDMLYARQRKVDPSRSNTPASNARDFNSVSPSSMGQISATYQPVPWFPRRNRHCFAYYLQVCTRLSPSRALDAQGFRAPSPESTLFASSHPHLLPQTPYA